MRTSEELVQRSVKAVNVNMTHCLLYPGILGTLSQKFERLLPIEILGVATQRLQVLLLDKKDLERFIRDEIKKL